MSDRISTFSIQYTAASQMMALQTRIARTQQQLSSNSKLLTAQDDPVAAGIAVALERSSAEYVRYGSNANLLSSRLNLAESQLTSVNDRVSRLREIAIAAQSGIQNQESRKAFLAEVQSHYDALLAAANSSDGQDRFLFGGTQDGSPPFIEASGGASYIGDQTRRGIDIAPDISVADVDPGSEVFQRIGAGRVIARQNPANIGTGAMTSSGFTDPSAWISDSYRVQFLAGNYTVLDSGTNVVQAGAFSAAQPIVFRGFQLTLDGVPADGDEFVVAPAPAKSIFATVKDLLTLLKMPDQPAAAKAAQQNGYYASIDELAVAGDHLIDARSGVGARLATLDRSSEERDAQLLGIRETLSKLQDLDYAEAISRLNQETITLEAAQQTYLRIQSLSLFDKL